MAGLRCVALLLCLAVIGIEGAVVVNAGDDADNVSPVQRVVSLLEKMKLQLESEGSKESEMYDKMVCWCETNEKEKTKAVADAETKTNDLTAEINSRAARGAELATEIAALKDQIANDKAALLQGRSIREKEAATFTAEEKDMLQAITNLKNAVDVLSRHNGGASMLQMEESPELLASVKAVLRDVSLKYELMQGDDADAKRGSRRPAASLLAVDNGAKDLGAALRSALSISTTASVLPVSIAEHALAKAVKDTAFVQLRGASKKAPVSDSYESYSSRSSSIFGILKQMKDEFEANLSAQQKAEIQAAADYKVLAASKSEQIEVGQIKLDNFETDHADNQKALSDAKENFELTRNQRAADVEFLRNLKLTCNDLDSQWAERSATRSEELKAVTEALGVLKEDDARELMSKTVTFLQQQSVSDEQASMKQRRIRAVSALRKAAKSPSDLETDDLLAAWQGRATSGVAPAVGSPGGPRAQLSTLAVSVELDSFAEVQKIMDKMVVELKKQQEEEVASKAYCGKEFDSNEKETYAKNEDKDDLEAKMESLTAAMSSLDEQIAAAKADISETSVQKKKASEAREQENAEFQSVVADQRATQTILTKALARLEAFYKKESLVQQNVKSKQEPPVKFNTYKKNAGSNSVMGLLESIIGDSAKLESEAVAGEKEAQSSYEAMIKSSNQVIADLEASIAANTKALADAKLESEQAQGDHTSTVGELESLAQYEGDLHMQCDFLLKNFDIRQRARLQEIEAIQGAKGILAGSSQ